MLTIGVAQATALAQTYYQTGKFAEGEAIARAIIASDAGQALAHLWLGACLRARGLPGEAILSLIEAMKLGAPKVEVLFQLGHAQLASGDGAVAIGTFHKLVELRPASEKSHLELGYAFAQGEMWSEAAACFRRALSINANFPEAHFNLGRALAGMSRYAEARDCYQHAISLRPDYLKAHGNLGSAYLAEGMIAEAITAYRQAVAVQPQSPEAKWNLGIALLTAGEFAEGWSQYEFRWQCESFPGKKFPQPRWDGLPKEGQTILLHTEQGYGDTIQFSRYFPAIAARAKCRLLLSCPGAVTRLMTAAFAQVEVVDLEGKEAVHFDAHLPLPSAPLTLGRFEPQRMDVPYLRPVEEVRALWRSRMAPEGFRVGIVWAGNPDHVRDRERSIAAEAMAPIMTLPGVTFHSLQVGQAAPSGIVDLAAGITDFADTAAIMTELDLIITVDTAAAHLAGALGRPVWTLLPFVPDWRWGLEGESTPWYPTMRLFRQKIAGDWEEVIERVRAELQVWARG